MKKSGYTGNKNAKKPDALKTTQRSFRIHPHTSAWLKILAKSAGVTESAVIRLAVQHFATAALDEKTYNRESARQSLEEMIANKSALLRNGMTIDEFDTAVATLSAQSS